VDIEKLKKMNSIVNEFDIMKTHPKQKLLKNLVFNPEVPRIFIRRGGPDKHESSSRLQKIEKIIEER